jgi:hypothetical protein
LTTIDQIYTIFKPLGGEGTTAHTHEETPHATLERVHGLHEAFAELKTDMMEEVKDIEKKLIIPSKLARDALKPMEKAIKRREDTKVRHAPFALYILHADQLPGRLRTLQEPLRSTPEEGHPL